MIDVSALKIDGITDPRKLIPLSRARRYSQYIQMVRDVLAGKECPFCKLDPECNSVLVENGLFHAWQSKWPEQHTKHHFIIVPKRHVVSMSELSEMEQFALFDIMNKLKEVFAFTSCGILIRDIALELAGTIDHLHIHMMVPDGTGRVESPFCKGDEADKTSLARAVAFEKIRTGTSFRELSPEEQELTKDVLN